MHAFTPPRLLPQVHYWLLANNHYIHGAYILEIVKNQWEQCVGRDSSPRPLPRPSLV